MGRYETTKLLMNEYGLDYGVTVAVAVALVSQISEKWQMATTGLVQASEKYLAPNWSHGSHFPANHGSPLNRALAQMQLDFVAFSNQTYLFTVRIKSTKALGIE